jgi:hypothetical protein
LLRNGGSSASALAFQAVFGSDLDLVPIEPMVLGRSARLPRRLHDEYVTTLMKLGNQDKIVYEHYSRYSDEKTARMNVVITLTRLHAE